MGERGPLPLPYARRRNKRQVASKTVTVAAPAMPRTLQPEAKAEWRRIVPELREMGILAIIDRGVLMRYCTAWADWCDLDAKLQQTGSLIKGRRDALIRNPLWLLRRDAEETLADLGRQLGLTPGARLRAGIIHKEAEEDDEKTRVAAIEDYRKALRA